MSRAGVATKAARSAATGDLKVLLVVGVVAGHATMAWTDEEAGCSTSHPSGSRC